MIVSLGPIEIEIRVLERQLRYDLRDDWFPDPLRFDDKFKSGHVAQYLKRNFDANHGKFVSTARKLLNVPKKDFTLRYGLEVSLAERALYHAIAMQLAPFYDPLLPPVVFNHRVSKRHDGKYLFNYAISAWNDFNGVVGAALKDANGEFLLSTDLANYFDNINLKTLQATLIDQLPCIEASSQEKSNIRHLINVLFGSLETWSFSDSAGLPQNRDASSFLSNIYMLPVDREMLDKGYRYHRYMDDIKIVCEDKHEARRALNDLCIELRKLGLSVNSGKTQILSVTDREKIEQCLELGGFRLQRIDSSWRTKSRRPIARSLVALRELSEELLSNGNLGSRAFRFCIARLERLASCREFEVPDEYFQEITRRVIDSLPDHASSTDQICKYLSVAPTSCENLRQIALFLQDDERNYYEWQNYRLWVLLVQKQYEDAQLLAYARKVVESHDDSSTRCGATLYAGAMGGEEGRIEIAKRFHTLKSFLGQRLAILAIHKLGYRPYVEQHVAPFVRDDLEGVFRNLRGNQRYVAPPKRTSITELVDSERDYA